MHFFCQCRECCLPLDVMENVLRKVLISIVDVHTGRQRRREWECGVQMLGQISKEFSYVVKKIEYETQYADLNAAMKRSIFEKVVRIIKLERGEERYGGQGNDCKLFMQCKLVSKNWKYWISRLTSGVEMRKNVIDIDI